MRTGIRAAADVFCVPKATSGRGEHEHGGAASTTARAKQFAPQMGTLAGLLPAPVVSLGEAHSGLYVLIRMNRPRHPRLQRLITSLRDSSFRTATLRLRVESRQARHTQPVRFAPRCGNPDSGRLAGLLQ